MISRHLLRGAHTQQKAITSVVPNMGSIKPIKVIEESNKRTVLEKKVKQTELQILPFIDHLQIQQNCLKIVIIFCWNFKIDLILC